MVTAAAVFFFKKVTVEGLITSVCNQGPEGPEPLVVVDMSTNPSELIRGGAGVTSFIPEQQRAQIWSRELECLLT